MKEDITNKIKQIILEDKQNELISFRNVLKSDMLYVLQSYLNDITDVDIDICTSSNGAVIVRINAIASSLQKVGSMV